MTKRLKSLKAKSLKTSASPKAPLLAVLSFHRQSFDLPVLFPNLP